MSLLRRMVDRLPERVRARLRRLRYGVRAAAGRPAGGWRYRLSAEEPPAPAVEVRVRADRVERAAAAAWRSRQTLRELAVVGCDAAGAVRWREPEAPVDGGFLAAPGELPGLDPAALESALLVALAEEVDGVLQREGVAPPLGRFPVAVDVWRDPALRGHALLRADRFTWDAAEDALRATGPQRLVKVVDTAGVGAQAPPPADCGRRRRGPYVATAGLPALLEIGVRDAAAAARPAREGGPPGLLVLAPFLARGGAEHTLYETLRVLRDRFHLVIATLAPHRAELGDRRDDFRGLTPRLYSLGDLLHPDAMRGVLVSLLRTERVDVVYNANGSTLFYDFGPHLKAHCPGLRIVDHLYDHHVGYIDRYRDPGLPGWLDACVAENGRIAEVLTAEHGWDPGRVPVIWPCGRAEDAFPPPESRPQVRERIRAELGLAPDDVVLLTAARMHEQKRPLDLVRLAERVRDLDRVRFLVVGGGPLEGQVDAAIAASGLASIRRLAFRTDVPDLVVAADAGCLVSAYEGLPVFMLECFQAGRPFLGTDVGDLGKVLREAGAGIVVDEPGDLDALEAAVRRLADDGERAAFARRALEVAPRFSVEHCAEAYARALLGSDER